MFSRRAFVNRTMTAMSLAALPLPALRAAKVDSTVKGVKLGLITGSLNPLPQGKDPDETMALDAHAIRENRHCRCPAFRDATVPARRRYLRERNQ